VWPVARFAQGASLHVLCRQWLSLYRVDPYYDLVCGQWPDLDRVHLARGQWPRLYRVHLFSLFKPGTVVALRRHLPPST